MEISIVIPAYNKIENINLRNLTLVIEKERINF